MEWDGVESTGIYWNVGSITSDLWHRHWNDGYPLVFPVALCYWTWIIEIVDLNIKDGDSPVN